ncbi:uracil-DNA glycosylase-like protein [Crassisporium funariophilum]|nr:uracil-DNA glycosylase-like protein [Crassisporium funariophilum]
MPKDTTTKDSREEMLTSAVAVTSRRSSRSVVKTVTTVAVASVVAVKPTSVKTKVTQDEQADSSAEASSSMPGKKARPQTQVQIVTKDVLDSLERDTMGQTWQKALQLEFTKPYFTQLKKFLLSECTSYTVYPAVDNIYSWSNLTPLDKVKIVIIGQDPYHDVGQAHGLSFSVLPPNKPPPSLKNIYKQLVTDIPGFKPPATGDLTPVAKQGVLWLNTSLTVRAHKAGSHARKGWETFTAQAIRAVLGRTDSAHEGVVFMAWGLPAQKTCAGLGIDKKKHLLLESAHPSPLSAHRGFLGNGHFKLANEWLCETYGKDAQIDWTVLSAK